MNLEHALLFLFASIIIVGGCTNHRMPNEAKQALDNAARIELYSLNPDRREGKSADQQFHDWEVLGQTVIEAKDTRRSLVSALQRGVNASDGSVAACFNPRHGIRVTRDETTFDFVICFECLQIQWHIDSEKQPDFLTTSSPQPTLDKILTDADIPLPAKGDN